MCAALLAKRVLHISETERSEAYAKPSANPSISVPSIDTSCTYTIGLFQRLSNNEYGFIRLSSHISDGLRLFGSFPKMFKPSRAMLLRGSVRALQSLGDEY